METTNIEVLVRDYSEKIAEGRARIAQTSRSEEEIRIGCWHLIDGFLNAAGISAPVRGFAQIRPKKTACTKSGQSAQKVNCGPEALKTRLSGQPSPIA